MDVFLKCLHFFKVTSQGQVRNTLRAALERRTRSHGRKSKRATAGGPTVQDGVLPVSLCVCSCVQHAGQQCASYVGERDRCKKKNKLDTIQGLLPSGPEQTCTHWPLLKCRKMILPLASFHLDAASSSTTLPMK